MLEHIRFLIIYILNNDLLQAQRRKLQIFYHSFVIFKRSNKKNAIEKIQEKLRLLKVSQKKKNDTLICGVINFT